MKLYIFALAFSAALCSTILAQKDSAKVDTTFIIEPYNNTAIGPIIGYRGFSKSFGEIGIALAAFGHGVVGYELTYMNNFKKSADNISGFCFGLYKGFAIFETGIQGNLFTNFSESKFYLKPFFALGIGGVATFGYGYNFTLGDKFMSDFMNPHEFRVILRIPVLKVG